MKKRTDKERLNFLWSEAFMFADHDRFVDFVGDRDFSLSATSSSKRGFRQAIDAAMTAEDRSRP